MGGDRQGRVARCGGCAGYIVWKHTSAGKQMPLDAQASAVYRAGDWVIEGESCRPAGPLFDPGPFHRPHWASCEAAEQYRDTGPQLRRVVVQRFGKG